MAQFRRNILASFVSQFYVALVGIAIVPVYLHYMGNEAYGLVGFFILLQSAFLIFDLGLTPTMSRQCARFAGGAISLLDLRRQMRILEGLFAAVGLLGAAAMVVGAPWMAQQWLNVQELPLYQVEMSIRLMGCIVGLRWFSGLYRGVVSGLEHQVWMGSFNAGTATARFLLVIAVFEWVGTSPLHFFGWQLIVAVIETVVLIAKSYRSLPSLPVGGPAVGWHWTAIQPILGLSAGLAFSSVSWVLLSQMDKLVLSKVLPLTSYGYFTTAVLAASGVSLVASPIGMALMPRLAKLHAQGDEAGLLALYRQATQWTALLTFPIAMVMALCSGPLLWVWTQNAELSRQVSGVLSLYALGNAVLSLAAFPYYLQYAKGDLRLHLIGNVAVVSVLVPLIVLLALGYGAIGVAWAWLGAHCAYILLWVWKIHARFYPGLHSKWLGQDIAPIALAALAAATIGQTLLYLPLGWVAQSAVLVSLTVLAFAAAAASSSSARALVREYWMRRTAHGDMSR